jgi:hypothetical protein
MVIEYSIVDAAAGVACSREDALIMSDLLGKVLGDFEILRELGRGGMGIVYEARQLSLNCKVALKVLARPSAPRSTPLTAFAWAHSSAARVCFQARRSGTDSRITKKSAAEPSWFADDAGSDAASPGRVRLKGDPATFVRRKRRAKLRPHLRPVQAKRLHRGSGDRDLRLIRRCPRRESPTSAARTGPRPCPDPSRPCSSGCGSGRPCPRSW